MGPVILDDALRAKLNGLNEPVPVIEPTGETVGHFVPEDLYVEILTAWARKEFSTPEASHERDEARADYRAGRGLTTEQAITYLRDLRARSDRE